MVKVIIRSAVHINQKLEYAKPKHNSSVYNRSYHLSFMAYYVKISIFPICIFVEVLYLILLKQEFCLNQIYHRVSPLTLFANV